MNANGNKDAIIKITKDIVNDLQNTSHHFIKEDKLTGAWVELPHSEARDKVRHALMHKANKIRKAANSASRMNDREDEDVVMADSITTNSNSPLGPGESDRSRIMVRQEDASMMQYSIRSDDSLWPVCWPIFLEAFDSSGSGCRLPSVPEEAFNYVFHGLQNKASVSGWSVSP
jgi:hypothetical protein